MQIRLDVNSNILEQLSKHLNTLEDRLSHRPKEEINQILTDHTHALLHIIEADKFLKFCQDMGISRNETIEFCAKLLHLTVNPSTHFDT